MQIPLVMVMAFLVARQAVCIAGNLTINELLNSHKYGYMRRDDDTFYNRFDRGPVTNCVQFWSSAAVAWDDMYHQERLVNTKCHPVKSLMHTQLIKSCLQGALTLCLTVCTSARISGYALTIQLDEAAQPA